MYLIILCILDGKITKIDDKKTLPIKPSFGGSSQAPPRKDSTGQKVESQSLTKPDDASKPAPIASQAPQPQRTEKTPPFSGDKQQTRYVAALSNLFF